MPEHRKRRVAASLSLAALATLGAAVPASAATGTGGYPVLYAGDGNFAHTCTVIGSADGYQGVVCVDILTGTSGTDYWARGQLELLCQKGSGSTAVTVRCAQVDAVGRISSANGNEYPVGQWVCGHQFGACSSGRNDIMTSAFFYSSASGCASNPNSAYNVWTVAYGTQTSIELPVSGKVVYLGAGSANDGANESTGHHYICA
jgi:hypothetical protein